MQVLLITDDDPGTRIGAANLRSIAVTRPVPNEVFEFIGPYPDEVFDLAIALRARVLEVMPNAHEFVWDATNAVSLAYTPTTDWQDGVVHIACYTRHVNLGFNDGATLDDPLEVLSGSGRASATSPCAPSTTPRPRGSRTTSRQPSRTPAFRPRPAIEGRRSVSRRARNADPALVRTGRADSRVPAAMTRRPVRRPRRKDQPSPPGSQRVAL